MRDFLFIFWGTLAGLTALATGVVMAWEAATDMPLVYLVITCAGGLVYLGACLTAQFVVDKVGK